MVGEGDDGTEALFDPYCSRLIDQTFDIVTDESREYYFTWLRVIRAPTVRVVLRHPLDAAIAINSTIRQPERGLRTHLFVLVPPGDPRYAPRALSRSTPIPSSSPSSSPSLSSPSRTPKHGWIRGAFSPATGRKDYHLLGNELRLKSNWAILCRGTGEADEGLVIDVHIGGRLLIRTTRPLAPEGLTLEPLASDGHVAWRFLHQPNVVALAADRWCPTAERAECELRRRIAIEMDHRTERFEHTSQIAFFQYPHRAPISFTRS